ncbi:hypothetical protein BDW59DRAFT_172529 [Aspergillus cavernicola]|uniref:Bromodomain associated domain-containing protein n=1 Tax=Aspergillus cavernicola TaxID=176166 RepID=A0ABR4IBA1_9EURO
MAPSEPTVKRSFSSISEQPADPDTKRIKRHYHHHHCLQQLVNPGLPEPAIADESYVNNTMSRVIRQSLRDCGFDIADPLAVEGFRNAAEEYLLKLSSYVRTSMLSSRRLQPIPPDFEYALKRHSLPVDSLHPYLKPSPKIEPIPTQLPSPPSEDDDDFKTLPFLGPQLSGEDDRVRSPYIPKHFPEFPSKHTYRHTPVFTERERDPRKIRERAADDGRHGEEALRKLARAAFKDNQPGSGGSDKKQWGRKTESFEGMFEKTVKGLSKKASKNTGSATSNMLEFGFGAAAETDAKLGKSKGLAGMELPPIINCERELWRRSTMSGRQRPEEKSSGANHTPDISRVEGWPPRASRSRFASSLACRIGSHEVVSTHFLTMTKTSNLDSPSEQPHHRLAHHNPRRGNPILWRVARVLYHFQKLAFLELYRATLATFFFLEVPSDDIDMICFGEQLLQEVHGEGLDELLHDLRVLHSENVKNTTRLGVAPIDELLELLMPSSQHLHNQPVSGENPADDQLDAISPTVGYEPSQSAVPVQPAVISRAYPVLEISSTSSAVGKSQSLYYITALAVLPPTFNETSLGGFGSAVVFIDTDGRFDAERLRTVARGIVRCRLQTRIEALSYDVALDHIIESILLTSLQHVHVFRPQSSLSLLATLQSLDTYLLDLCRHTSANRVLQSIILDSATAFFWQDKLQDEIARTEDIGRPSAAIEQERLRKESFYLADVYADLVATLKHLQQIFDCAVIYTTTSFNGRSTEKPSAPYGSYNPLDTAFPNILSFRSPLPPPWGMFPTLRLVLQRDTVRPLPPSVTVSEAVKDAPTRQEAVMRGEFLGSVNGWGREDWPRRILEELKRRDGGRFFLRIGREGVTFG